MTVKVKVKVAIGLAAAGGLAYWLWTRSRGGTRPVCGPGATWHEATTSDWDNIGRWSLPVQEQLKKWGGYCAKQGTVSEATPTDGPILYPWQVE